MLTTMLFPDSVCIISFVSGTRLNFSRPEYNNNSLPIKYPPSKAFSSLLLLCDLSDIM
jgi:hypothetical protein